IVEVLLAEHNALQGILRGVGDFLKALAVGGEDNVTGHAVFAVGAVVFIDSLNRKGLGVGIVVALTLEFVFALGKALDNVVDRHRGWVAGDGIVSRRMDSLGRRRRVIGLLLLLGGRRRSLGAFSRWLGAGRGSSGQRAGVLRKRCGAEPRRKQSGHYNRGVASHSFCDR